MHGDNTALFCNNTASFCNGNNSEHQIFLSMLLGSISIFTALYGLYFLRKCRKKQLFIKKTARTLTFWQ